MFGCDCQVFLYLLMLYNGAVITHCDLEGLQWVTPVLMINISLMCAGIFERTGQRWVNTVSQWWIQEATGSSSIRFLPRPWSYLLWSLFGADYLQWHFTEYSGIRNRCILHQIIIMNCDLQLLLTSEASILAINCMYILVWLSLNVWFGFISS